MIQHYIYSYFNFDISEIIETMQYVSRYFALDTSKDMPNIIR